LAPKPEDERQLRELAKLRIEGTHEYDTEAQKIVWQIAQDARGQIFQIGGFAARLSSNQVSAPE